MYVTVSPVGTVTFRYDYRLNGRRETLTIGRYGAAGISLALAREKLIDAKKAVALGKSPALEKQREKRRLTAAKTFGEMTEKWLAGARMADSTNAMRKSIVDRDILPAFENRQLNEITADDLRALCNKVKARGAPATTVTLPRYRRAEADDAAADVSVAATPAPVRPLTILIVDDNVDAAQILAMYIEAIGHRASVWHSPGKAVVHAAAQPPDMAVLDIGLPEFDGHELARRLRALPGMAHVPLLAVSGYGQAHDREKALAAGFDRHFVKPVKAADILAVLEEVARKKGG
jgi:CheY-like chemotaxis protein